MRGFFLIGWKLLRSLIYCTNRAMVMLYMRSRGPLRYDFDVLGNFANTCEDDLAVSFTDRYIYYCLVVIADAMLEGILDE